MLPRSQTKRPVNHARPDDVPEDYAADWTVTQLQDTAQRVADRIDKILMSEDPSSELFGSPAVSAP